MVWNLYDNAGQTLNVTSGHTAFIPFKSALFPSSNPGFIEYGKRIALREARNLVREIELELKYFEVVINM